MSLKRIAGKLVGATIRVVILPFVVAKDTVTGDLFFEQKEVLK